MKDTVAVVDDDPAVRASVAAIINALGMQCQESKSAEEFLAQGREPALSCIVLDLCLPGMNGQELLNRLAARLDAPPVIVISGFASVSGAVRMMRDGAFTVLEKPCRPQELGENIQRAVVQHQTWLQQRLEAEVLKKRFAQLTDVEREIAKGIANGKSNTELSQQLNLGLRTVEKRRQQIFLKLDVDHLPAFIELLYRVAPEYVVPVEPPETKSNR